MIWMMPTIIDEAFGEIVEPEYSNIVDTKNSKPKSPLNCSRNCNTTPIASTFFAGLVTWNEENIKFLWFCLTNHRKGDWNLQKSLTVTFSLPSSTLTTDCMLRNSFNTFSLVWPTSTPRKKFKEFSASFEFVELFNQPYRYRQTCLYSQRFVQLSGNSELNPGGVSSQ